MNKKYFLYLILGIAILSWSQTPPNSAEIQAYFKQELTQLDTLFNKKEEAGVQHKIVQILEVLQKSRVRDSAIAESFHQLGRFSFDKPQNLNLALLCFESALSIRKSCLTPYHTDLARNYFMLGSIYKEKGNYLQSVNFYRQATNIRELKLDKYISKEASNILKDSIELAKTYIQLGDAYIFIGDPNSAIPILHKALTFLEIHINDNKDSLRIAKLYNTIGASYFRKSNINQSIVFYQKSIQLYNKLFSITHDSSIFLSLAYSFNNLGIALTQGLKQNEAINAFQKTLDYYNQSQLRSPDTYKGIGNTQIELANCFLQTREWDKAQNYYQQAAQQLIKSGFKNSPYLSEAYIGLGNIAKAQNNFSEALSQYHRAVGVLMPEFSKAQLIETPSVSQAIYAPIEAISALSAKAQILYALRQSSPKHFMAARGHYALLDSLIMDLKNHYKEDGSKFDLITRAVPIYERALSLALQAKDSAAALRYFDRTKAIVLREGLYDHSAKQFAGIPQAVLDKEKTLELDIAFALKKLAEATTETERSTLNDSLFNAKRRLERFVEEDLKRDTAYSRYYNFKYNTHPPLSIADVQSRLKDKMLLVEYFVGDDSLYTFTATPQKVFFKAQVMPKGFKDSLELFRLSFSNFTKMGTNKDSISFEQRKQIFERLSPQFYTILLHPPLSMANASGTFQRLRIIPDGLLGYLPFSLLMQDTGHEWTGDESQQPSFVINKYAISYDYSRELMFDSTLYKKLKIPQDRSHRFGGFGIQYDDLTLSLMQKANKQMLPLPKSPLEVRSINAQIGGDVFTDENKWYRQRQTYRSIFLEHIKKYNVLHLSMHASMDDREPLNSALIFSKHDSADNNLLTAAELYAHDFKHNDLTVLSACNTASGAVQRGEGIMSLSRALSFAGCKSLIATLWSVGDNDMYLIMPNFYKYLQQGMDKDLALQKAQLEYLKTNFTDPNHWAAPILVGDISNLSITPSHNMHVWQWAILALLLFVLMFVWYRRSKKGK